MVKLSVIIVTFNRIDIVRDCLDSIKKYNDIGDALEVIVSDNSTDETLVQAIQAEYHWVKVIKNSNQGFGAGNNRGYEISQGEYLLFLNPDTILIEPIFQYAIKTFEKDTNLALFGIQLLKVDGKRNYSFHVMDEYGILALIKDRFSFALNRYCDGKMFITGADLFVRRESFQQAGCFDENIFMYKEEADLIKRIKLYSTAKKTRFCREKRLIHLEGGTEDKIGDERRLSVAKRIMETDRYYCQKYNISLNKVLRQRIRQSYFKKIVYSLLCKRRSADTENKLIQLYKQNLE